MYRPGLQWECRQLASILLCLPLRPDRKAFHSFPGCPSSRRTCVGKMEEMRARQGLSREGYSVLYTCPYFSKGSVIFLRFFWKRMAWMSWVSTLGGSRPCIPKICRSCRVKAMPWETKETGEQKDQLLFENCMFSCWSMLLTTSALYVHHETFCFTFWYLCYDSSHTCPVCTMAPVVLHLEIWCLKRSHVIM